MNDVDIKIDFELDIRDGLLMNCEEYYSFDYKYKRYIVKVKFNNLNGFPHTDILTAAINHIEGNEKNLYSTTDDYT